MSRLTCFALIGCTLFNWVSCIADRRRQLSCVGEVSIATRRRNSSWVELRRYKRALRPLLLSIARQKYVQLGVRPQSVELDRRHNTECDRPNLLITLNVTLLRWQHLRFDAKVQQETGQLFFHIGDIGVDSVLMTNSEPFHLCTSQWASSCQ